MCLRLARTGNRRLAVWHSCSSGAGTVASGVKSQGCVGTCTCAFGKIASRRMGLAYPCPRRRRCRWPGSFSALTRASPLPSSMDPSAPRFWTSACSRHVGWATYTLRLTATDRHGMAWQAKDHASSFGRDGTIALFAVSSTHSSQPMIQDPPTVPTAKQSTSLASLPTRAVLCRAPTNHLPWGAEAQSESESSDPSVRERHAQSGR